MYVNRLYFPCWCTGLEPSMTLKACMISYSASGPLADLTGSQTTEDTRPASGESCGSLSPTSWKIVESLSQRSSGCLILAVRPAHASMWRTTEEVDGCSPNDKHHSWLVSTSSYSEGPRFKSQTETSYPDCKFPWCSLASPGKCWESNLN
jgi:hypothetical protein